MSLGENLVSQIHDTNALKRDNMVQSLINQPQGLFKSFWCPFLKHLCLNYEREILKVSLSLLAAHNLSTKIANSSKLFQGAYCPQASNIGCEPSTFLNIWWERSSVQLGHLLDLTHHMFPLTPRKVTRCRCVCRSRGGRSLTELIWRCRTGESGGVEG